MWSVPRSWLRIWRVAASAVWAALILGIPLGGAVGSQAQALTPAEAPAEATAGSSVVHHYEYVFHPGAMYVYDMDDEQKLVQEVTGLHDTENEGMRGVMVDPATSTFYISHGGDGPGPEDPGHDFDGSLLAYDLVTGTVLWNKSYSFPVDSGAITPDGSTIYMPTGENDPSGIWNVLNTTNGELIGSIQGPANAHNTIVSLDGKYVFLAALSRPRGRPKPNPLEAENARLQRRLERAEGELAKARRVIEVQGNVSALLGELLKPKGAAGSTER